MILALAGGVGGAKLATGLARVLPPGELTVVVNTGDDFEHLGLHISPDVDTVMYNLAGRHNPQTGWGVAGETWRFMEALRTLGGEDWFQLGDQDMAVHVERTRRMRQGETLSDITTSFCAALGITQHVVPMSDDPVRTIVDTDRGRMAFQDYFVRTRCEPRAISIRFDGAELARPAARFDEALKNPNLDAIVICPSNPYLSVDPILSLSGVAAALRSTSAPVLAVSPIVAGKAIKGPAAKLLSELGHDVSALSVARHYAGLVDTFVLDTVDAALLSAVQSLGMRGHICPTIMQSDSDKETLARVILSLAKA